MDEVELLAVEEVKIEKKHLKNGIAISPDNLPNKFLEYCGEKLEEQLPRLRHKNAATPDKWKRSIIVLLSKIRKRSINGKGALSYFFPS